MTCPFSPLPEAHIAHLRSKVGAFLPACLSLPVPSSQEQLQPQSVARELRLDQRNAELLVKKLDSFDLLVLLVVVSHTHFLTKARGGLKMQCHANKIKQDETRVKNRDVFEDVFRARLVYKTLFLLRGTPHLLDESSWGFAVHFWKVNFLFAMCTEEGFLEYSSFRQVESEPKDFGNFLKTMHCHAS